MTHPTATNEEKSGFLGKPAPYFENILIFACIELINSYSLNIT